MKRCAGNWGYCWWRKTIWSLIKRCARNWRYCWWRRRIWSLIKRGTTNLRCDRSWRSWCSFFWLEKCLSIDFIRNETTNFTRLRMDCFSDWTSSLVVAFCSYFSLKKILISNCTRLQKLFPTDWIDDFLSPSLSKSTDGSWYVCSELIENRDHFREKEKYLKYYWARWNAPFIRE